MTSNQQQGVNFKGEGEGKGSTFSFVIPRMVREGPLKVLVVDDDPEMRSMIKALFAGQPSYEMEEVSTGTEAVIRLGSEPPDLLILDLLLPGLDGKELCQIIRERPLLSGMKVIIVTAYPENPKIKEIRAMGFTRIYGKPLNIDAFMEDVHLLMG